ncbi:hypothetical protein BDA99DRAFT_539593 [Phascolomyces articulosus]|uniref:Uncharacterized protein n=1 Tax=Phascolomyces articulosus TaxID=60185 RepID=A0AAD5JVI6_9FUNG|nr:hypothetical protein BDA99DRAFT_539593 [Phascolomyces articulosus]
MQKYYYSSYVFGAIGVIFTAKYNHVIHYVEDDVVHRLICKTNALSQDNFNNYYGNELLGIDINSDFFYKIKNTGKLLLFPKLMDGPPYIRVHEAINNLLETIYQYDHSIYLITLNIYNDCIFHVFYLLVSFNVEFVQYK